MKALKHTQRHLSMYLIFLFYFIFNYILLALVFTKNSNSKLYKVRINSSVLQDFMKYIRKLQLKGKKQVTTKIKCLKKKKTVYTKKKNCKKTPVYFSEFSKFVILNSNFSLYINFFHLE